MIKTKRFNDKCCVVVVGVNALNFDSLTTTTKLDRKIISLVGWKVQFKQAQKNERKEERRSVLQVIMKQFVFLKNMF